MPYQGPAWTEEELRAFCRAALLAFPGLVIKRAGTWA